MTAVSSELLTAMCNLIAYRMVSNFCVSVKSLTVIKAGNSISGSGKKVKVMKGGVQSIVKN